MARKTVAETQSQHPYCLPMDAVNRADVLCEQINAIVQLMGSASLADEKPPDNAFFSAAFVVSELIDQIHDIVAERVSHKP